MSTKPVLPKVLRSVSNANDCTYDAFYHILSRRRNGDVLIQDEHRVRDPRWMKADAYASQFEHVRPATI